MDLEIYTILAMVILVATLVTIVFAVCSYFAFRLRRAGASTDTAEETRVALEPRFFKRYEPGQ